MNCSRYMDGSFVKNIQKQEFNKIWHYKDWARENPSFSQTDIGIDLVGELKNDKGLAAIQCKFFQSDHQITKEDLDSFVSASSNEFKKITDISLISNIFCWL